MADHIRTERARLEMMDDDDFDVDDSIIYESSSSEESGDDRLNLAELPDMSGCSGTPPASVPITKAPDSSASLDGPIISGSVTDTDDESLGSGRQGYHHRQHLQQQRIRQRRRQQPPLTWSPHSAGSDVTSSAASSEAESSVSGGGGGRGRSCSPRTSLARRLAHPDGSIFFDMDEELESTPPFTSQQASASASSGTESTPGLPLSSSSDPIVR